MFGSVPAPLAPFNIVNIERTRIEACSNDCRTWVFELISDTRGSYRMASLVLERYDCLVTVASLLAGIAAALFALLAWLTARQRQPFTLKRAGNLVLLTRTRRPTVQLRRVHVFGHSPLITADAAATTEWRILQRDQHIVLSLETPVGDEAVSVHPSETVTVQYRRLWPWDPASPNQWLPAWKVLHRYRHRVGDNKNRMLAHRKELDSDGRASIWKEWHSSLL